MEEPQTTQEKSGSNATIKWVTLIAGVGCALLACTALVVILVLTLLGPSIGNVFSEINQELEVAQPAIEEQPDLPQLPSEILTLAPEQYPDAGANSMGDPNAPVKMIVYSDFQCIYCMRYWSETESQIIETYVTTGKVYYEYRSFGDFLGQESGKAAEAAYCAGDQGKFWEYHDLLFFNWTGEGTGDFSPDKLEQYASKLDLDLKSFSNCLSNGNTKPLLERDVADAQAGGIHATPSFLINGKLVEGAQPFSVFQDEIETALGKK